MLFGVVHCTEQQCKLYSVQWTVYSLQCKVYSVQFTFYSVQFTVYTVQCTFFSVQIILFSIQCIVYTIQYTVYSTDHLTVLYSSPRVLPQGRGHFSSVSSPVSSLVQSRSKMVVQWLGEHVYCTVQCTKELLQFADGTEKM